MCSHAPTTTRGCRALARELIQKSPSPKDLVVATDRTQARLMPLTNITPGVWEAFSDVRFMGMPMISRTTIATISGGLFVCSPGALSDELRREIDAIGEVRAIAAPNRFHHLFIQDWRAAYPDASVHVPESLKKKRPDLVDVHSLGASEISDEIAQQHMAGFPTIDETWFFHRPSGTLIDTDLMHNMHEEPRWYPRMAWRALGMGRRPRRGRARRGARGQRPEDPHPRCVAPLAGLKASPEVGWIATRGELAPGDRPNGCGQRQTRRVGRRVLLPPERDVWRHEPEPLAPAGDLDRERLVGCPVGHPEEHSGLHDHSLSDGRADHGSHETDVVGHLVPDPAPPVRARLVDPGGAVPGLAAPHSSPTPSAERGGFGVDSGPPEAFAHAELGLVAAQVADLVPRKGAGIEQCFVGNTRLGPCPSVAEHDRHHVDVDARRRREDDGTDSLESAFSTHVDRVGEAADSVDSVRGGLRLRRARGLGSSP